MMCCICYTFNNTNKTNKITKPLLDEESLLQPHTPSLSPKGIVPLTSGAATDSWAPVTAVVHMSSDLIVLGGGINSCIIIWKHALTWNYY